MKTMPSLVTIHLTPEQADMFAVFHKRYTFIKALEALDIFDIVNGSIEVHFGPNGEISRIHKHLTYRAPVDKKLAKDDEGVI